MHMKGIRYLTLNIYLLISHIPGDYNIFNKSFTEKSNFNKSEILSSPQPKKLIINKYLPQQKRSLDLKKIPAFPPRKSKSFQLKKNKLWQQSKPKFNRQSQNPCTQCTKNGSIINKKKG